MKRDLKKAKKKYTGKRGSAKRKSAEPNKQNSNFFTNQLELERRVALHGPKKKRKKKPFPNKKCAQIPLLHLSFCAILSRKNSLISIFARYKSWKVSFLIWFDSGSRGRCSKSPFVMSWHASLIEPRMSALAIAVVYTQLQTARPTPFQPPSRFAFPHHARSFIHP